MEHIDRCMSCMLYKGDAGVCPHCGYQEEEKKEASLFLEPRTILHGKYLIGCVLGQGGFGITYTAWDLVLDLKVAVKEFFPQGFVSRLPGQNSVIVYSEANKKHFESGIDSFLREAQTLARFEYHPNIVYVRDFFRDNNTAYMVTNYIEGLTLKEYLLRKGGKLTLNEAMDIMMPVMDAMKDVHGAKIMHRDISPDNILINTEGRVILIDFGAARQEMRGQSKSLSVILKVGYAPEEQYRTKGKQGPWTDIYAIAACTYRCITGVDPPESIDRLAEDTIIKPSELGVAISATAEEVLMKALEVRASNRYQDISEFQDVFLKSEIAVATASDVIELDEEIVFHDDLKEQREKERREQEQRERRALAKRDKERKKQEQKEGKEQENREREKPASAIYANKVVRSSIAAVLLIGIFTYISYSAFFASSGEGDVHRGREESTTTGKENVSGNIPGNIVNAGIAAMQNQWIIFSNDFDGATLYKLDTSDSSRYKLNNARSHFINVVHSWIYYSNADDGDKIYRISINGDEEEKLNDDESWFVSVANDFVYYINMSDDGYIYKMNTDGTGRMRIIGDRAWSLNVAGDWIYYSNDDDNRSIYKVRTNGTQRTKLNDAMSDFINVAGDWVYYSNHSDNGSIYRLRIDGTVNEQVNASASAYLNVVDDWIYFSNNEDGGKLYRINVNGTELSRLNNNESLFVNVVGNIIIFCNGDDEDKLHKIFKDSGEQREI